MNKNDFFAINATKSKTLYIWLGLTNSECLRLSQKGFNALPTGSIFSLDGSAFTYIVKKDSIENYKTA